MQRNVIHTGNSLEILKTFPDNSIDCCITSPPYYGLRDYGTAKWINGDEDCDHSYEVKSPYNENFNERWGNASGQKKQESQRHKKQYTGECGKCGAIRIDNQIGLEETPSCNRQGYFKLKDDLSEQQKQKIIKWLLGEDYHDV